MVELVRLPSRNCDVLMAPHHGSMNSDPQGLLAWCQPKLVVISGGRRRVSDASVADYTANGTLQLARTDRHGAIRVHFSEQAVTWQHWERGDWVAIPPTAISVDEVKAVEARH